MEQLQGNNLRENFHVYKNFGKQFPRVEAV